MNKCTSQKECREAREAALRLQDIQTRDTAGCYKRETKDEKQGWVGRVETFKERE